MASRDNTKSTSNTESTDSSGISFTAFYTGEVWRRHGLSVPFLGTTPGKLFYMAGRPVEWAALTLLGGNNEILLLQRHVMIDHVLEKAVQEEGFSQIVEIACGLSPRSTIMSRRFADRDVNFIEADLPGMANRKRGLLAKAGELSDRHRVVSLNILEPGGRDSLERVFREELDPARKTLVITEGLVNYFDYPTIHGFWTRLAEALKAFPAGLYVTDLYPDIRPRRGAWAAKAVKSALAATTRSRVTLHFDSEPQIQQGFRQAGFASTRVHVPESYYGVLDIPKMRGRSLVRVIENRVG